MKLELLTNSTTPNRDDYFWQFILIPTVTMFTSFGKEKHYAISFEWLFWSTTILIYK